MADEDYFPPSECDGGLCVGDPNSLGVDLLRLKNAVNYNDNNKNFHKEIRWRSRSCLQGIHNP